MKLTIHRGSHEVGGTCIEVVSGGSRIVLDVGMPLFDNNRQPLDSRGLFQKSTEQLAAEGYLPNVPGLFRDGKCPDAILLSHAHLDHVGLIDRTRDEIPIYASRGTSKMMLAGALFAGQRSIPRKRHKELYVDGTQEIGNFRVTPFPVDHSVFGCVALLIEADGQALLYTGDLRLHGRKTGMAKNLIRYFENRDLDVLVMEGTHFGFPDGERLTEYELEDEIVEHVKDSPGLVLASFSPQHLDRLVGFMRAAKKNKRTFVADAYTAFVLHLVSGETPVPVPGKEKDYPVYFPATLRGNDRKMAVLNEACPSLAEGEIELAEILSEPSKYLMVFRDSMLEPDFGGELPKGTVCLHSRWQGYLEQPQAKKLAAGIEAAGGRLVQLHTSGHMLSEDIVRFVESLQPTTVIPVHTFEPEEFAKRMGDVRVLEDGQVFEVPAS